MESGGGCEADKKLNFVKIPSYCIVRQKFFSQPKSCFLYGSLHAEKRSSESLEKLEYLCNGCLVKSILIFTDGRKKFMGMSITFYSVRVCVVLGCIVRLNMKVRQSLLR